MLVHRRTARTAYYEYPPGTIIDQPPPGETADVVIAQPMGQYERHPHQWTKQSDDKYTRTSGPLGWVTEHDFKEI